MPLPPLVLRVIADTKAAQAGLASVQKQSLTFGKVAKGAALAGAAALVGFAAKAVKAASDLGEAQNKANVIFGNSAKAVHEFAETSAEIGIAKAEALSAAGAFGAMLDSAGLAEKQSAEMSVTMVKLAADMASFNNEDPSEMLTRLRSGLAGEAEPLRRFGAFISEARVKTEAFASGIAEAGSELTDAQKIQARYNIILRDTAKQQGDFARTAGTSLPNQLRKLSADFTNLAADVGQALLPAVMGVVRGFSALMDIAGPVLKVIGDLAGAVLSSKESFELLVLALHPVAGAVLLAKNKIDEVSAATKKGGAAAGAYEFAFGRLSRAAEKYPGATVKGLLDEVRKGQRDQTQATNDGVGATKGASQASKEHAARLKEQETALRETTDALRNYATEQLAQASGFLGIQAAADQASAAERDVATAQARVNELRKKGKKGTDDYKEAIRELRGAELRALETQVSLESKVLSYLGTLEKGTVSQSAIIRKIREMGREAGLSRGAIQRIIESVRGYVSEVGKVPKKKFTDFKAQGLSDAISSTLHWKRIIDGLDKNVVVAMQFRALNLPTYPGRHHGGPVSAHSPYIVGEGGPELFVPAVSGQIVPNGDLASGGSALRGAGGDRLVRMHIDNWEDGTGWIVEELANPENADIIGGQVTRSSRKRIGG